MRPVADMPHLAAEDAGAVVPVATAYAGLAMVSNWNRHRRTKRLRLSAHAPRDRIAMRLSRTAVPVPSRCLRRALAMAVLIVCINLAPICVRTAIPL